MASDDITYFDYIKDTFNFKVKIPLLGYFPVNKAAVLAFAALGFANPGFWFAGAAAEIGYLFFLAGNSRFQKVLLGRRLLKQQKNEVEIVRRQLSRLSPGAVSRYRKLAHKCSLILDKSRRDEQAGLTGIGAMRANTVNQLMYIFMRLLASHDAVTRTMDQSDWKELERKTRDLERRLTDTAPDSPLYKSLSGTLEIQRKRLENVERARESLQIIAAELTRIEEQVELIREESAVTKDPEVLSVRLDAVSGVLNETSGWMEQHSDFLRSLGQDELFNGDMLDVPPQMPGLKEGD